MPKPGYATITIAQQTYDILKKFANDTHRSIPQVVELLAERAQMSQKKEG